MLTIKRISPSRRLLDVHRALFKPADDGIASVRHPAKGMAAFTVVELLVATSILMIITGLLLNMFSKSSDAWLNGQQVVERQRSSRIGLELISRDLSQAMVSTSSPSINFFGFSNGIYFVTIVPTQIGRESDMGEVGYRFDANSGKLYRYYSPPTNTTQWNPRHMGGVNGWIWPNLTNTFLYSSEADTLVADGVVDLKLEYYTNSVIVESWTTTNVVAGGIVTNTLPKIVDITLITMPAAKWKVSGSPGYDNLTNLHSRSYQTTVHLMRGGR